MAAPAAPTRCPRRRQRQTTTKPIRRTRVARAQSRIRSGYYERHEALVDLVALRLASDLRQ